MLCVEIYPMTKIGSGLQLWHVHSLVIHPDTIIGKNCVLRQSTTIGVKNNKNPLLHSIAPVIGDNVDIGANVVIIGSIKIGDGVSIGAGSVVVKDILNNSIVAGNPAKLLR